MASPGLDGVTAVVVTHRRPRLATAAVRYLVDGEGFDPKQVVVVVNGEGGLDDPDLQARVRLVALPTNTGPAGGFRQGLLEAFADPSTRWAYLCEDDISLLDLPAPRVADVIDRVSRQTAQSAPVGAVAPFGRVIVPRSGHTRNYVPRPGLPGELAPVDVTMWAATLVSRDVVDAGVLPDPEMFFGFEDFDFFFALRDAGFSLLVDVPAARRVVGYQTLAGRDQALRHQRPTDAEEPWRAYYFARNFITLARRHGRSSWIAWHMLYSLRRLQKAASIEERMAIVHGLLDGARRRLGVHPRYQRQIGENPRPALEPDTPAAGATGAKRSAGEEGAHLAPHTVALVVSHNAPEALARCLHAVASQTTPPAAVVVVDNASDPAVSVPNTPGMDLPTSVLRSEVNTGPAGGWAVAFEAFRNSTFDLAWVLDDDIVPDRDCLQSLLVAAEDDPKSAFCFPRSVQPDGGVGEWGSWCGLVVARRIVEEVGVPRAELFWWAEDNEYLLWRIPQAGYPRRIVDGALVQHDAVRQDTHVPTWKYYYEARNMLYLHLHVMHRVGWYPRNVVKLFARALTREKGRRLVSLAAMSRGLFDGARGRLGITYPVAPMRERADSATRRS